MCLYLGFAQIHRCKPHITAVKRLCYDASFSKEDVLPTVMGACRDDSPLGQLWSQPRGISRIPAGSAGTFEASKPLHSDSNLPGSGAMQTHSDMSKRAGAEQRGRNILVAPSSPLYEFGSGRLAAKAAGQYLPQAPVPALDPLPQFSAGKQSSNFRLPEDSWQQQ